ncbi:hypothetical protein BU14_0196s0006 [Porphyra umbilicalis]|uniref:Uncharacterized protein n=1 Tax=Porphyra umbilicalis TaxID=2786 RepID=A0A1X6P604_PORUM|nr:hypothetical protein BU14_0196s0006 [Porphyra umbilicalis]|eukprot:OSX76339.1 hypothetical protein BU14_0196s0006 [Porphyra umbilicalis]
MALDCVPRFCLASVRLVSSGRRGWGGGVAARRDGLAHLADGAVCRAGGRGAAGTRLLRRRPPSRATRGATRPQPPPSPPTAGRTDGAPRAAAAGVRPGSRGSDAAPPPPPPPASSSRPATQAVSATMVVGCRRGP